ncbi:VRR-NUC domain protein [compost metagenome]
MKNKTPLSSDQKRHQLEATLTSAFKSWLELQPDIAFYKASDRYNKGISDFIICVRGMFVGVELKRDEGTPSAQQNLFIKQILDSGGIAGVAWTLAEAKALVEEARQRRP